MLHRSGLILSSFLAAAVICSAQTSQGNDDFLAGWARNVLTQGSSDKDPETRREVAVAFSLNSSRDASFPVLVSLVKDRDYLCRAAAITSISEMSDPELAKLVLPALEDDVPEVMFAAAKALYRLGNSDGKQALISILEKEEKAESGFF